jgi:3-hydroxyisobutyrate dehydrogenase
MAGSVKTVGFIGLGSQGGPMARRIIEKGFSVMLWARRPAALDSFADTAAERTQNLAGLGARCDLVCICVVDDAGVRQIADVLLPAMRRGSQMAIHSTVHPATCVELARQAAVRGVAVIDAPVSGGGPAAAAGTLTVMVGGEAEAIDAARPVFESFAAHIFHLGAVGAGQSAKLINNALMAANMALGHAALGAGEALGIERSALVELIKVSSGRSFGFDVRARMPDLAAFGHGAALLSKDVGLLGEVLGADPAVAQIRAAAQPFLEGITQVARKSGGNS